MDTRAPELSRESFGNLRQMMAQLAGIELSHEKLELIKSRLSPRLRQLRLSSYEQYLSAVQSDHEELSNLVDALTTNKTSFFREAQHFSYLRNVLVPRWKERRAPVSIWSAGCSTGEEPYSLAMLLKWELAQPVRILATDISRRVLTRAQQGVYNREQIESIPQELRRSFTRESPRQAADAFEISPAIKQMVKFARLNLMGPWRMRGPFDLILCRNVMIYFNQPTRAELVRRFRSLLGDEGTFFVGHAETLNGIEHSLRTIRPAIYAV